MNRILSHTVQVSLNYYHQIPSPPEVLEGNEQGGAGLHPVRRLMNTQRYQGAGSALEINQEPKQKRSNEELTLFVEDGTHLYYVKYFDLFC